MLFEVGQRSGKFPPLPVDITLVRIHDKSHGRALDDDNLAGAFKAIRDQLATMLLPELTQANQTGRRGDDSDPRLSFSYEQRRGDVRGYAVEITIKSRS